MSRSAYLPALAGVVAVMASGCSGRDAGVLGADPGASPATVVSKLKSGSLATLAGTMIEKCPTAGCWFMLKDGTGVVRVDTKTAGFTVTDVALNTRVTILGTLKEGTDRVFVAKGMRF